ncbi:hypothetical protein ACNJX9_39445 [Bradyrhizobium sp. DASA03076]|uniref:hypothetical protein n=1 Tax=Bradyrhizobium sp. BLXBL-03 TaxID=3395916 RepID=UPI003F70E19D
MPSDPVTNWAKQAVDGDIVVGELVRYAAERHLRDLRDGPARGLHWVPERAIRVIRFFPALFSVTAGAKAGAPFDLLPWQMFCTGSLFGWHSETENTGVRPGEAEIFGDWARSGEQNDFR